MSPAQVIRAWFVSRSFLNNTLKCRPKANVLKGVVEPPGGDAEERLMWRHMVDAVVLPGQDYVQVLEDGDVPGKAKVCV